MAASLLVVLAAAPAPAAEVIDRIVIRVSTQIATQVDFERRLGERRQSLLAAGMDDERRTRLLEESGLTVFDEIYQELLVLSRGDQIDATVPDDMIEQQVQSTRERMGLQSEADFERALAQSGLTIEELRQQTRRSLRMQRVMAQEMQERIDVEEEDLRRFYRENEEAFEVPAARLVQEVIILETAFDDTAALTAVGDQLLEALAGGAAFADAVAPLVEAGQSTPLIDHGWVDQDDLAPELGEVAWSLEPGSVSEPIAARGGLHFVRVIEAREEGTMPFEEVREQVEIGLRQERMETVVPEYMRELEQRGHIVLKIPDQVKGFKKLNDRDF